MITSSPNSKGCSLTGAALSSLYGIDRRIGELALTNYLYVFLWLSYRLELFFNLMRPKTVWLYELLDT